jgi:hypothetical protein
MTDRDDREWLLARERGEPAPPLSEGRAGHYAQLGTLIADLPAMPPGMVDRQGWEHDVLAAMDATADAAAGSDAIADAGRPAGSSNPLQVATDEPPPNAATADRPRVSTPTARRRRTAVAATAVAMAAGIAMVLFMRHSPAIDPAERNGSSTPIEVTRGIHVEAGRLAFDHAIQVTRSNVTVPHELRDGDTLMTGDRLRVFVVTSIDAHLYLAFCASQHLQMLPSPHGALSKAGQLASIPGAGGELLLDDQLGSEVLYVIVSQPELSQADPALSARIATASDPTQTVDCGATLDRLMKSEAADGVAVVRYRFNHVAP